eukprot:SAG22_NODE_18852_length_280_cov_1.414365_1_plen_64_part_10
MSRATNCSGATPRAGAAAATSTGSDEPAAAGSDDVPRLIAASASGDLAVYVSSLLDEAACGGWS